MNVKGIVQLIHLNSRQGPKDIISQGVYDTIAQEIGISYKDYKKIVVENSIPDKYRQFNRNVYFVERDNGAYDFLKSNEDEIRPHILKIIQSKPNMTSAEILKIFKITYTEYTLIDRMPQLHLSSQQDIIDQTVRNILVSNFSKTKNCQYIERSTQKPYRFKIKGDIFEEDIYKKIGRAHV